MALAAVLLIGKMWSQSFATMPHPQLRFALPFVGRVTESQEPMTEPHIELLQTNQNIDPAITSGILFYDYFAEYEIGV